MLYSLKSKFLEHNNMLCHNFEYKNTIPLLPILINFLYNEFRPTKVIKFFYLPTIHVVSRA